MWWQVNFLEEAPPPEFENLLTVSVMSTPVVCVQEVRYSGILAHSAATAHVCHCALSWTLDVPHCALDHGRRLGSE